MDVDNLIHMANRIGEFFQAMPDRAEAVDGVATHIRKFWEPRWTPAPRRRCCPSCARRWMRGGRSWPSG